MDVLTILDRYKMIDDSTQVIGNYVKISCPFHPEEVASMSVRLDNGLFHCFGCGWKGNMQSFVKKMENVNDLQALLIIKKYGNFEYVQKKPKSKKSLLKRAYLQYISADKTNWNQELDNYMVKQRWFKPSTLNFFKIKIEKGSKDYPIMIPILDNNKFKGLLRRRIDNNDAYKYLNNKGFSRNVVLGGIYKKGCVLIVEGYLDMMMAYQLGYKNVACLFHWKASECQIEKVKAVTNRIIVATDNTPKGIDGYEYLKKYFKVKRFIYPDGCKDIGDIKSKYTFRKCVYDTIKREEE